MIEGLKPYPEYKDIDIPSFGSVPKEWKTLRGKCCYREVDERSKSGREVLCSVSHKTGVTPRKSNVTMFMAESTVGYKICRPNDLVINTLWAWMAALGIARQVGIVSPAYGVYRPLANSLLSPSYADRLLRTPQYMSEYIARSTGVNASRLRLYPEQFLCIPLLIPPPDEQAAIVKFLDYANAKIERAIRAKRKQLSLVRELLIATTQSAMQSSVAISVNISQAVDVKCRQVVRDANHKYVTVGLFNRGRGLFHKSPLRGDALGDSEFYWVDDGDLIISGQFAWEGAVALAGLNDSNCIASHRFPILRGRENVVSSAVLFALLRTSYGQLLLDVNSRGAAGRNRPLNLRSLLRESIPIPSIEQQKQIEFLVSNEQKLIRSIEIEVRYLNEFQDCLTAEVVTGKLDVREAAKRLPDEAVETLPPDDSMDELIEDEIDQEDDA